MICIGCGLTKNGDGELTINHDCSLVCEDGVLKQPPETFEMTAGGGDIVRIGSSGDAGHDEINEAFPNLNPQANQVERDDGIIVWTNESECRDAIAVISTFSPDTRAFVAREPDAYGTAALDIRQTLIYDIDGAVSELTQTFAQYNSGGNGTAGDYSYSVGPTRTTRRVVPAGGTITLSRRVLVFKTGNGHPVTTIFYRPIDVQMIAHLV